MFDRRRRGNAGARPKLSAALFVQALLPDFP
jgi:hypothetical protein